MILSLMNALISIVFIYAITNVNKRNYCEALQYAYQIAKRFHKECIEAYIILSYRPKTSIQCCDLKIVRNHCLNVRSI